MAVRLRTILSVMIAVGIAAAVGVWAETASPTTATMAKASAAAMNPFEMMRTIGENVPVAVVADPI
jgi:hypothetical protein